MADWRPWRLLRFVEAKSHRRHNTSTGRQGLRDGDAAEFWAGD